MRPLRILVITWVVWAAALYTAAPAARAAGDYMAALDDLAAINGMALYCKRSKEVEAIKTAVTTVVPKTRKYGARFESGTTQAFLNANKSRALCPVHSEFRAKVKAAIERLEKAFAQ